VLVPDKNFEFGIRGLLSRPAALGIREVQFSILVHPKRDPGCVKTCHELLRLYCRDHQHAVLLFDKEGSGQEETPTPQLATSLRGRLAANGWGARAEVIVLEPELEIWVFSPSMHVEHCLGWKKAVRVRDWLESQGLWTPGHAKPARPKEAVERVLFDVRRPRSSSLYECLGRSVSTNDCQDAAFNRFLQTLAGWFPPPP
jgi:hypothetical protein